MGDRINRYAVLLFGLAVLITDARQGVAQTGGLPPRLGSSMPSDIDLQSGFRLPFPKREDLDEAGKRAFDRGNIPGASIAGLQGPAGIQLYSTKTGEHLTAVNQYLRFGAGISARIREIAILITAREMDSQFEWVAHEPEALKDGVPENVIDVIKYRKSTVGLDETDAFNCRSGSNRRVR